MRVGSRLKIGALKKERTIHIWKYMVAELKAAASRDSDGSENPTVGECWLRRAQFGEDETEIKRVVLTLKYSIDDETGYSCDVILDVSAVFHNNRGQQCGEKESLGALDSGD